MRARFASSSATTLVIFRTIDRLKIASEPSRARGRLLQVSSTGVLSRTFDGMPAF